QEGAPGGGEVDAGAGRQGPLYDGEHARLPPKRMPALANDAGEVEEREDEHWDSNRQQARGWGAIQGGNRRGNEEGEDGVGGAGGRGERQRPARERRQHPPGGRLS